ncbi:MAG: pilus assembly protein [Rhodomicrobium sp.]|nr:pilus assembly protein [Rhodomicrobium sp.]
MIEFALVLPILAVLFVGLVEFGEAFTLTRKLSNAAGTVSDLVSQQTDVSTSELNDIALVAQEIIKPYRSAPLDLVIVSVVADADNNTTVAWSHPASAYAAGTAYTLPNNSSADPNARMTEPHSSIIVAEAEYAFTPTVGSFLGSFTITERAYFRPRFSAVVTKN